MSDESQKRGTFFANNGYVYISVDVRGRGNSDGEFNPPGKHHAQDIHDVIDWLTNQPWSDGRVVMRGGSYRGMVQWQSIIEGHEGLRSIVPTAATSKSVVAGNGIPRLWFSWWLGLISGTTLNTNLSTDVDYWRSKHLKYFHEHVPYSRFWELVGVDQRIFSRMALPEYAEFREALYPMTADYAAIKIPTLSITGYWDGAQLSTLSYREQAINNAPKGSSPKHFLIIGPWSHAGTRQPTEQVLGMNVGANAVIDLDQLHLDWYDWVLKEGEKPEFLKDMVTYYVLGPNVWRHAASLDQTSDAKQVWYLDSVDGKAHDVFDSGELASSKPYRCETRCDQVRPPRHIASRPVAENSV